MQRREVPLPGAPRRPAVRELGPRQRDDVDRPRLRPLQHRLDEIQEPRVGPLHVLEHHRDDAGAADPFEEHPPRGEQLLAAAGGALLQPEQERQAGLHPPPVLLVRDVRGHRLGELGARDPGGVGLRDLGAHPHHLAERPERDALPVGGAPPVVPPHVLRQAVDVLEQLPRQPRLADAADARDRDHARLAVAAGGVQELLEEPELLGTPHERRLDREPVLALALGHHPERAPGAHGRLLALQVERADLLERDRARGRAEGGLAHEHGARLGRRLEAGGRVDHVAGHHALVHAASHRRRLTGEDAGARLQRGPGRGAERRDLLDQLQRRPDGAFRVVLVGHRRAPQGHHGVADELLDDPAVALDHRRARS